MRVYVGEFLYILERPALRTQQPYMNDDYCDMDDLSFVEK